MPRNEDPGAGRKRKIRKEKCVQMRIISLVSQLRGVEKLKQLCATLPLQIDADGVESGQQTGVAVHKTSCIYDRSSFILY